MATRIIACGDAAFARAGHHRGARRQRGHAQIFRAAEMAGRVGRIELGNRASKSIPTPGHHPDHLVFIDHAHAAAVQRGLSADPAAGGRHRCPRRDALNVIEAVNAYGVQFALGAHIEMAASGELYSTGATFHPDERALPLPFDTEHAVARQALQVSMAFLAASRLCRGESHPQPHRTRNWRDLRRWYCWCGSATATARVRTRHGIIPRS